MAHVELQEGSSLVKTSNEAIAAVSIKPPIFDENSVSRWFVIMESQFILSKIASSNTKFHHVISNLPINVINQLNDSVIFSNDYNVLKNALVTLYTRSKPELFDSLLSKNNILFTKPTIYLQELRKFAAPLEVTD